MKEFVTSFLKGEANIEEALMSDPLPDGSVQYVSRPYEGLVKGEVYLLKASGRGGERKYLFRAENGQDHVVEEEDLKKWTGVR